MEYESEYDWLAVETDEGERGWAATDFLIFDWEGFPASYPVPVHPAETRTGVGEVDALIATVHARDARTLAQNLSPSWVACVAEPSGDVADPPLCEDDEPEGTLIEVLPFARCHGYFTRVESIGDALVPLIRYAPRIYAVFEVEDWPGGRPPGDYAVVFALAGEEVSYAHTVYVDGSGIAHVSWGCGTDVFEAADRGNTFLLQPPPR